MAKHEYIRCPVCGKLSPLRNFQVHKMGGRHRSEIMVQEISSEGRARIRNKWYPRKLSFEEEQKLRTFLRGVLRDILKDISKEAFKVKEEEIFEVRTAEKVEREEKAVKEKKEVRSEERTFKVKVKEEVEEEVEAFKVKEEIFEVEEEDRFEVVEEKFKVL